VRSPSIIYLVTRTHGRRIHLLTPEIFKAMSKSKSLSEIVDQLLRSDYSAEIGKLPSGEIDSVRLERIFLRALVERFLAVVKDSNGKAQEFLQAYATRIEVENLKRVLRAKHAQEEIEEQNLIPLEREETLVNFPALTKAGHVEEAVSLLRETAYASLKDRLDAYRRVGLPIALESFLDSIYFSRVWEKMEGLPGYEGLKWLVGGEVDLRNLQLIFTLKMREIAPRLIEEMTIPVFYRLSRNTLARLVQAGLDDAPGILAGTSYTDVAEEILRKSKEPAINLETLLSRRLYQDASFALRNLFLESGYVVAYLLSCEREARNLVTLTTALDLRISDENLQRRLF
jgi:vacuolar-type H+-ATPase subunit C/Vma6